MILIILGLRRSIAPRAGQTPDDVSFHRLNQSPFNFTNRSGPN